MNRKKWIRIFVVSIFLLAIVVLFKQNPSEITHVIIQDDKEIKQGDFLADEEKGLVGCFVEPQTLIENENVKIKITKLVPTENFCATVEVVVENNVEENVFLYTNTKVDEAEEQKQIEAIAHTQPIYKETVVEEVYKDGEKIEENVISNPESFEEFYFRKKEYFIKSENYKYKQVFDIHICYADNDMEPEQLNIYLQVLYSTKVESIVTTEQKIELLCNEEIVARADVLKVYDPVTSFNNVNQEIVEVGNMQYVLERNMLLLRNPETEEEQIIYQPQKRGHYILKYFVGESCVYFLEETPGEEIANADIFKKYVRLCVMNRDGTELIAILDDVECEWFYIPALYVYKDILYMYDWDFLHAYRLDAYGKPKEVILKENSIYSNVYSDSLLIYDPETERNHFYGLPFWLERFEYRVASSESGEAMMDKNGEWETFLYMDEDLGEEFGFFGTDLEAVGKNHLVFGVFKTDQLEEAYIYNLEDKLVEGILTLPNGDTNCQAISMDEAGIYFKNRAQTVTSKQQSYYYEFATKTVQKVKK